MQNRQSRPPAIYSVRVQTAAVDCGRLSRRLWYSAPRSHAGRSEGQCSERVSPSRNKAAVARNESNFVHVKLLQMFVLRGCTALPRRPSAVLVRCEAAVARRPFATMAVHFTSRFRRLLTSLKLARRELYVYARNGTILHLCRPCSPM